MNSTIELDYTRTSQFYPKQEAFINCKAQHVFCLGANKSGKTDPLCIWIMEQSMMHGGEGKFFCWLSPASNQSEMAFKKCNLHLKRAGILDLCKINNTKMTITMPNLSVIRFVGSERPQYVWGYEHTACVVDEASHVKEESWNALLTTLYYTQGKVRAVGNPTSRFVWFYKCWLKAKLGEYENGEAFRLTAYDAVDAGVLDRSFIDSEKKRLSKANFQKNIMAELPDEDDTNPFGISAIQKVCKDYEMEEVEDQEVLCYGVDLAKSVDYTVICGLNKDGVLIYFNRFQKPWELTKGIVIGAIGDTETLVDSTGVGDPILESLQRKSDYVEGYKYNNASKCNLVEKLAIAIQQGEITIPSSNEVLLAELECFETQTTPKGAVTYNAGTGHDDCVNSLALAVWKWDELTNNNEIPLDFFVNRHSK